MGRGFRELIIKYRMIFVAIQILTYLRPPVKHLDLDPTQTYFNHPFNGLW
jgi:hypothetical protein